MTHKDIYTKFMIEYDKANVTSSYPSFTQYEIATLLDKAYDVVIDRKFTGINTRRAFFESDIKAIADLQPLVKNTVLQTYDQGLPYEQFASGSNASKYSIDDKSIAMMPSNVHSTTLPTDMLYLLAAAIPQDIRDSANWLNDEESPTFVPIDSKQSERAADPSIIKHVRYTNATLVSHQVAQKFFATANNIPWVPNPVCYIEGDKLFMVVDPVTDIPAITKVGDASPFQWISVTYLKKHHKFVKDSAGFTKKIATDYNYSRIADQIKFEHFGWKQIAPQSGEPASSTEITNAVNGVEYNNEPIAKQYEFELSDTVANEVVSTAITFALENVESARLNSHSSLLALES